MRGSRRERQKVRLKAPSDLRKRKFQSQQKSVISTKDTLVLLQTFTKKSSREPYLNLSWPLILLYWSLVQRNLLLGEHHCLHISLVKYFVGFIQRSLPIWNISFHVNWMNQFSIHHSYVTYPAVTARISDCWPVIDVHGRNITTQSVLIPG